MTPAQLEHLKLIDAHLERLLAKAEKRTPGRWVAGATIIGNGVDTTVCEMPSREKDSLAWHDSIHFIASCAGNAEAGWKATRVAIAALSKIAEEKEPVEHGDCGNGPYVSMFRTSAARFAEQELKSVLAAFPLELIQKP